MSKRSSREYRNNVRGYSNHGRHAKPAYVNGQLYNQTKTQTNPRIRRLRISRLVMKIVSEDTIGFRPRNRR